jgi:plasmid stabilization system protein ParE
MHPRLGRIVPEEQIDEIRESIFSPYRVVYEIYEKEKLIYIVRVWHSARGKPQID